jgi:hypothetical protein
MELNELPENVSSDWRGGAYTIAKLYLFDPPYYLRFAYSANHRPAHGHGLMNPLKPYARLNRRMGRGRSEAIISSALALRRA